MIKWIKRWQDNPIDVFVEQIPFNETKNLVTLTEEQRGQEYKISKESIQFIKVILEIISQRNKGTAIGFGAELKSIDETKTGELMKTLEPEDLLKYGLIPEFIGRLPMIATLEDLDEKSLIKILQEPKNSLTKQYQELFKLDGAKLVFKENALKEIAQKAIKKKTGARGLRSILENILLKTMYELPSEENIDEVIIDVSAAKGQSQPILVHSKGDNKSKSNKTTAA